MKAVLKKILGRRGMGFYHRLFARCGALWYRNPSKKMIVIGVTGTKGKSTVGNMLWHILTAAGHTVGLTGTVMYRIGAHQELTTNKMTMSGRMQLQHWLARMRDAGCDIAIVETTSEGIKQFRHIGIHYDIVMLTNLTPEHIEAHGGFDQYKDAKMELFRYVEKLPEKFLDRPIKKKSIINMDSEHADDFAAIGHYEKVRVGSEYGADYLLSQITQSLTGTDFSVNGQDAHIPLLGSWNAYNATLAVAAACSVGVPFADAVAALASAPQVPGRMEFIDAGQPFRIIVDYAYEPVSLQLLYEFCATFLEPGKRIITLVSSTGGGRDVARRPLNGKVAGELCDFVIVTNEDPYDDDPQKIIDEVAEGVRNAGKVDGVNMWSVLDRREAIEQACRLAQPGDVVLLTAKGAEQKMCVAGGKKIDWDDRVVVREVVKLMKKS